VLMRVGLVALVGALGCGCDEVVEVEDLAPQVHPVGWCVADARTFLVLRLVDREAAPVDLALGFEGCAAGGRCTVETAGVGSGLFGLQSASAEPGVLHHIEWSNAGGAAVGEVEIEVQATDDEGRRPAERHLFPPLASCPG
jgi:hypothetical protein